MRVIQIERVKYDTRRIKDLASNYRFLDKYGVNWTNAVRLTSGTEIWICTFEKDSLAAGKMLVVEETREGGYLFLVEVESYDKT